jgi:hypothetical protein
MRPVALGLAVLAFACAGEAFEIVEPGPAEPVDPCAVVEVVLPFGETVLDLAPTGDLSACRRTACQNYVTHRLTVPADTCAVLYFTEGTEGPYRTARNESSSCGQATHPCSDVHEGEVLISSGSDTAAGAVRILVVPLESGECAATCEASK